MHYRKTLASLFLIVVTLAVFWQTSDHEFIKYDDARYITENPRVQEGLTPESVAWAFRTTYASNWHPLTWLSHMLDIQLFGLEPGWHHLMNVFFHAANTVLLFLLLIRMTGAHWESLFVAALFALHPLHVESVAWVAERKDVLSTMFWMLTFIFYCRYVERPGKARYLLAFCTFAFGLMAKPMVVTLPFVLLLVDYWPLGRLESGADIQEASQGRGTAGRRSVLLGLIIEKVPFFALSIASSIVTVYAQHKGGTVAPIKAVPLMFRAVNALVAYVGYMGKMFWPLHLSIIYPLPLSKVYPLPPTLTLLQGLLAALVIAGISVIVIRTAKRHPYLLVGWLWYIGTLVPVIGLVQVGRQSMADRYTYIPLIGLFMMIAWGAPVIVSRSRYRRIVLSILAGSILLASAMCTWRQLGYWKDSITLFSHAAEVVPDNDVAHSILGYSLVKKNRLDEAIYHYSEALRIWPDFVEVHFNLGYALMKQGKVEEAIRHYLTALRLKPDHEGAHIDLGRIMTNQGRLEDAVHHYSEALRINPENAGTHISMGLVLAMQGRLDEGIRHFREALRINPDLAEAHFNLGYALMKQGKVEEAIRHYLTALRLDPDHEGAHINLGSVLTDQGRLEDAVHHYSEALRINPENAETHFSMGLVLAMQGRLDESIRHFREALRINPDFAEAHYNIGAALAREGRLDEGIRHFREALRINPALTEARIALETTVERKQKGSAQ